MITHTRHALYQECLECGHVFAVALGNFCMNDNSELVPVYSDAVEGLTINDKYKVLSLCGSGSYGSVYRARHIALNKDVAIKFLHVHLIDNAQKLQRFENEARTLSELSHPSIVRVIDYGVEPQPFIVMDYAEGKRLDQILQMVGPFPLRIAINVFIQICEGMAAVHAQGLIHQDLKPSNILVSKIETNNPEIKILDFGTAKLLETNTQRTSEFIGSPPYMSPEQCAGEPTDTRSDVYSLGCLMYEILTGQKPFQANTTEDYFFKHLNQLPQPPSNEATSTNIPEELDRLICRTLSKQVDFRVQSMTQLAEALRQIPTESISMAKAPILQTDDTEALPRLSPGIGAVAAAFLICAFRSPIVDSLPMASMYVLYVSGLLCFGACVYWIIAVTKIQQLLASKQQCKAPGLLAIFTHLITSLPLAPCLAMGILLSGISIAPWIGWLGFGLYAAFVCHTNIRFFNMLSATGSEQLTVESERRHWTGTILALLQAAPVVVSPLCGQFFVLEEGIVFTCWLMAYTVLFVLKCDIEKMFLKQSQHVVPILVTTIPHIILCSFFLVTNSPSLATLKEQIHLFPDCSGLYAARGLMYHRTDQNQRALNDYNMALRTAKPSEPPVPALHKRHAQALENLGRYAEAAGSYTRAINSNSAASASLLIDRGDTYSQLGQRAEAISDFAEAMNVARAKKDKHNEAAALHHLGYEYFAKGDYDKAIAEGMKSINSVYADRAKFYVARSFLETKQYDEALKLVTELEEKSDSEYFRCLAVFTHCEVLVAKGDYKGAKDKIAELAKKYPQWCEVHRSHALINLAKNDLDNALTDARAAVQSATNDFEAATTLELLARIHLKRKEYNDALRTCQAALDAEHMRTAQMLREDIIQRMNSSSRG